MLLFNPIAILSDVGLEMSSGVIVMKVVAGPYLRADAIPLATEDVSPSGPVIVVCEPKDNTGRTVFKTSRAILDFGFLTACLTLSENSFEATNSL